MLYNFLLNFVDIFSFFNVFKYITFRTGLAVFTSLIIVLIIGNPFIRYFAIKEITNPIQTRNGYLILKINDKRKVKQKIDYDDELKRLTNLETDKELNKLGYIYGYTDNYVKVRHPWSPKLSNKIVQAKLTDIDNDGFVRIKLSEKKQRKEKQYLYSDSNW